MLLVLAEGLYNNIETKNNNNNKCVCYRATGFTTRSDIGPARDANDVS